MKYKLVLIENGRVITGQKMYDTLIAEGFEVPIIPRPLPMVYPVKPIGTTYSNPIGWDLYSKALAAAFATYNEGLTARTTAIVAFAAVLEARFSQAGYQVTGVTPQGQRVWSWVLITPNPKLWIAWAETLTGQYNVRPTDPIYKLSF